MKKSTKTLLSLGGLFIGAALVSSCSTTNAPLQTVPAVDLDRYQGRWHEIAKLPQRFEKNCFCVYAEYTKHPKGHVEVYNFCRKGSPQGKVKNIRGKAFPVPGSHNSKLKVQFFWPFRGDYWVLELDPDYQHVLVGSPDRESLWLLARTPVLEEAVYNRLVQAAKSKGFLVAQLEKMDQSCYK
ncbi:lipocalin family protein [Pontibacter liquoris]|uniref:lipocalin family protein n=1 Tax=Pontibacter liquoris TaxID=2905677 RepID=UPI001FA73712|nr:lipocalin family protein [Pontibacter liquoris]